MRNVSVFFLVLLAFVQTAAAQTKIKVVDIRSEEPPIFCRNLQDYENRLSHLFPNSEETADQFRLKNLQVSAQGGMLVIQAKVDFVSCAQAAHGYAWVSHAVGQDRYNLLAAPRSVLNDFITGYLTPIGSGNQVKVSIPLEQYLTNQQDLDAYHAGQPIFGKEIYLTYLPTSFHSVRSGDENPAIRLFINILP